MKWYLLSSCFIASCSSQTAYPTCIFSTTSCVCGLASLLSSSMILYPFRWQSLSQAYTAFSRSPTVWNMIFPRSKSLMLHVVSTFAFSRSFRMIVISFVHRLIISWTIVMRFILPLAVLIRVSILEIITLTRYWLSSFLNIFYKIRNMTLNCWSALLGIFILTP
jgi:hypothetical protein